MIGKTDIFRRKVTRFLTQNLGNNNSNKKYNFEKENIKNILICRPNHRLGNQLLITPLLQEIEVFFPESIIDLFLKGNHSKVIFDNYKSIDKIISLPKKHFKYIFHYLGCWTLIRKKKYDLVINVIESSSSGKLATKFAKSKIKFYGNEIHTTSYEMIEDYSHNAKKTVYNLRAFLANSNNAIEGSIPPLDIKLNDSEIKEGAHLIKSCVGNDKNTISIFTSATGEKNYSELFWNEIYNKLKITFPNHNFIEILSMENMPKLKSKVPTFLSYDIRKIASLIANTKLFIGADSGIMHLASASQTPTIGLFSVTDINTYQPYHNNNIGVDTNKTSIDQIIELAKKRINNGNFNSVE